MSSRAVRTIRRRGFDVEFTIGGSAVETKGYRTRGQDEAVAVGRRTRRRTVVKLIVPTEDAGNAAEGDPVTVTERDGTTTTNYEVDAVLSKDEIEGLTNLRLRTA